MAVSGSPRSRHYAIGLPRPSEVFRSDPSSVSVSHAGDFRSDLPILAPMLLNLLLLTAGLAVLIGGAEALVRGASALARRLGVPPIIVGLSVVAFGTSTPELAVNVA